MATYRSTFTGLQIDDAIASVRDGTCGLQGVKVNGTDLPISEQKVNIEMPEFSSGTFTPVLDAYVTSGSPISPTILPGYGYANGFYTKFYDLCYVTFSLRRMILSPGEQYVCISGLPFDSNESINKQSISVTELGGWRYDDESIKWNIVPTVTMEIAAESSYVKLENNDGLFALEFPPATVSNRYDVWIAGSGIYKVQED